MEAVLTPQPHRRGPQVGWLLGALFQPRATFDRVVAQSRSMWLIPLIALSLAAAAHALATGTVRQEAARNGEVQLPPGFEYYTPEQQAQYMKAIEATSSPAFHYVLPTLVALGRVWLGWLLVAGLVHLTLTVLGGRGEAGATYNVIAWAALPFALRDLVRAGAVLVTDRVIQTPGLSGFALPAEETGAILLVAALSLVDLYLIWHAALLVIAARTLSGLSTARVVAAVFVILLIVLAAQVGLSYGVGRLSSLTFTRAF